MRNGKCRKQPSDLSYQKRVTEINRLLDRYVKLGVPNRENLAALRVPGVCYAQSASSTIS